MSPLWFGLRTALRFLIHSETICHRFWIVVFVLVFVSGYDGARIFIELVGYSREYKMVRQIYESVARLGLMKPSQNKLFSKAFKCVL